ncbi:MAG TPA: hypothetical protein PLQ97_04510 [Myxococcota bacterium]|nr:hypothetical protein [Myxococcota bacterium]HQK51115.1 hypothetical protein [Myxococcota bacterium]
MRPLPRLPGWVPWAASLALLLAIQFLCWGTPVPTGNEDHYLAVLHRVADPSFLAGDWTFGPRLPDRWVFDTLFGTLSRWIPLDVLGWAGRIATWVASLAGLIRIARSLGLGPLGTTGALGLFLLLGQALVGGEWMLGWFEAKAVAWSLWIHGAADVLEGRHGRGALLAGLAAVFHPAVGLVAGAALATAMLAVVRPLRSLVRPAVAGIVAALPGLVQALAMMAATGESTAADWEFLARTFLRIHLDLSTFDRTLLLATILAAAGVLWEARRHPRQKAWRLIPWMLALPGTLFLAGTLADRAEAWSLMALTPFRTLPPLALLFGCLAGFSLVRSSDPVTRLRPGLLLTAAVLLCLPPLPRQFRDRVTEFRAAWATRPDPWQEAFRWVADHTPEDALVLAPPWRGDSALVMRRPQVVHAAMPRYDRLSEWHRRVADLLGEDLPDRETRDLGEVWRRAKARWSQLTPDRVSDLAARYQATFIITDAPLPGTPVFRAGPVAVHAIGAPPP